MKKVLFILFIFIPAFLCGIYAQTTVDIPGLNTSIDYNSGSNSYGSNTGELEAGLDGAYIFRSYIHWSNIKSYIPLGAQIQSVTIAIAFQPTGSTSNIEFHDYTEKGSLPLDYDEITSGTLYQTSPANQSPFSISQLATEVQGIANNNGSNDVYLGIKNQDESNSSADVYYLYNVNLHVTYTFNVNVTQLDASGSPFGQVGVWNGNSFDLMNVPFSLSTSPGSSLTLLSSQTFKPNTTEKYQKWNGQSDVINPHTFTVQSGTNNLEADFGQAYSNVIINISSDGSSANGTIDFKDPWLIDYNDPTYGPSNQGINAPFVTQSTPFTPTTGTSYMGVFLNQGGTGYTPPYYSVQAPIE